MGWPRPLWWETLRANPTELKPGPRATNVGSTSYLDPYFAQDSQNLFIAFQDLVNLLTITCTVTLMTRERPSFIPGSPLGSGLSIYEEP